jgi:septal ring factor EnvC (AmiA/AmiB activator)
MSEKEWSSELEIELLKKDFVSIQVLLNKFDSTINRLADICANLDKIISLQESRINRNENSIEKVHLRVDKLKEETGNQQERQLALVLNKMDNLVNLQTKHMEESSAKFKEMSDRLHALERWRYFILGASAVISFSIGMLSKGVLTALVAFL